MTLKEVEAQALKLSPAERLLLAKRLLAAEEPEQREPPLADENDPIFNLGKNPASSADLENGGEPGKYSIWGLGSSPVDCGVSDTSLPAPMEGEEDPIDGLGRNPVITGIKDGSVAHDRYLYGSPPA